LSVLNEQLLPILAQFGFDTGGGHFVLDDDEKLNTAQRIDRDVKLYSILGERIDMKYFEEAYKIPLRSYDAPTQTPNGGSYDNENTQKKK
jgi:hypothetical protein